MSGSRLDESTSRRSGFRFAELLQVQGKLALREPYALLGGLALPAVLLALFGFIGKANPGNVGDSGLTVIDLWTPTLLVISLLIISVSLPNTLVRDREIGWLRRVSTTPLHPSRLLAAQLIIDLLLAAAAVVIIIGVAHSCSVRHYTCRFCLLVCRLCSRSPRCSRLAWCWWPWCRHRRSRNPSRGWLPSL